MAQYRQIIRKLSCTMYWQHVMGQYWPSTGCRCTVLPVPAITNPMLKTARVIARGQVNRPILGRYWAAIQPLLDRYSAVTGPLNSRFWASIGPVMAQYRQIIRTLACTMYWQHVMGQYWPSTGCRCTVLPVPAITNPMLARYRHVDWVVNR